MVDDDDDNYDEYEDDDDAPALSTPPMADVDDAIRYLLQLAIESDAGGGAYEGGGALLTRVVVALNAHYARRVRRRREALVVEMVDPIVDLLECVGDTPPFSPDTLRTICKWFARRGFALEPLQVAALLQSPLRQGARDRSVAERALERLAQFADASQSELEKLHAVIKHGKTKAGRLGNVHLHDRAFYDMEPGASFLLLRALVALGVEEEKREQILSLLPPLYSDEYLEDAGQLADIHDAGQRLAAERRRSAPRVGAVHPGHAAANLDREKVDRAGVSGPSPEDRPSSGKSVSPKTDKNEGTGLGKASAKDQGVGRTVSGATSRSTAKSSDQGTGKLTTKTGARGRAAVRRSK
jgi:hypothetical protein